ncbi:right-handed parallel beta-helix repeat-containing protein [Fibrella forsythiae]|uniref:Right-handed parallel beta-helix repeat-containing protein n=1 Tax=Fibrella forsythiae TaxID=2817061 RepID=A0ABS3JI93_9BACT|nr:right-handed parallel beta-helix repeat-containing protein [Fibrella forsythiae]MBO0949735.1 right-handed parallel beta-helix repeat-containing protein [Fibrella forsythiae]
MFTLPTAEKKKYIYRYRLILIFSFLTILLGFHFPVLAQTTYYVSATGNDANAGTSVSAPFQSLGKVNSLNLNPGDKVLFRRGDTFIGTLLIRYSGSSGLPILFDAYGTGRKPVLSGSVPLTNWTNTGNNIWQAPCSSCGNVVTGVFRDQATLPLGRFPNYDTPNKGYMTIRAHTEKYQIFSQEPLPYDIDWKGGEVVMRPTQWIIDRAVIDAQYGDALNLFNYSNYYPGDGWGYFIQNHPATLDQQGEWYYSAATKSVKLFSSQTNPNSQTITATVQSRNVDLANVSNIKLQNLQLTQALNESVFATNVSSFTITNTDISDSGEDGLIIKGTGSNLLFENNTITDINNNGVYIDAYKNVTFRKNTVRRIGVVPGRGKSGDGQYNGIQSIANDNVLIENNTIDSVGYNGVTFWINTTIRQNKISNYCITKSDGGALYVWNGPKAPMANIHIVSNIIFNGIGAPEGSFRREYSGANGIFLDDCVENVEIRDNTVFDNHQWGIYLHATSRIALTGNTSFNNGSSQFVMYHDAGYCLFRENRVTNNIFFSKAPAQMAAQYESHMDDLPQYGRIDSNYYSRPFNEDALIRGVKNWGEGGNYSLANWQAFSHGHDLHSKGSPITFSQYNNNISGGVNRVTSSFDTDNNAWQLVYSPYGNAEAVFDNSDKLDGGSLRVSFPTPSGQSNSYAQVVKPFGWVNTGKTYVLRFDAIATTDVTVLVYLRQYGAPYQEFDRRYTVTLSPSRKSYELTFTSSGDDPNAVVMFQTDTEGPVFWLDNVRLQEDVPNRNNPDDFIKLYYNPTLKDSTVTLPAGAFRDVTNQRYTNSLILKPFTSVVLLRDTVSVAPADLSLYLYSTKRVVQVNELATMKIRVVNEGDTEAGLAQWTYRLPANSLFIDARGQPLNDNVLTGTVSQLAPRTDTTFTVSVRPTAPGIFRMSAQLTMATSKDPDSSPNTGTADGEDDASSTDIRVTGGATKVFSSPNPHQRVLPDVVSNQPVADATKADLSLGVVVSKRVPTVGELVSFTLVITNAGGQTAADVQIQNVLPEGVEMAGTTAWTASGRIMTATIPSVPAYSTASLSFQVRVLTPGYRTVRAQINASSVADPDSTPGNGFTNGEDDQVQTDLRVL